ncbi:hypothetical protein BKA65DRAFT_490504 [Rhexocercosporidium sp. MPI-PUGE-AT-0058]|nr:hypothetical protein BKA65DRAFT_490504 [Rhexocercosporidium sp. MPI-PUGE-AT-0058]
MATDYHSPCSPPMFDANAGQPENLNVGHEQPQAGSTKETRSREMYEWTDDVEAWTTETAIKVTIYKKKPDLPLKQNLPFVTETGTARPKGTSRTLIRSHARRKPDSRTKAPSQTVPIVPQNGNSNSRDESTESSSHSHVSQPHLSLFPRKAAVDPFQTLPVSDAGNTQFYIHYYDSVFSETFSPVNPRKEYLPFVMTDTALLHATLSHSSVRHNILHGIPSPDSVYHKAKAIQIVNRRLRKPIPECTDATITAVACLALFEQLTGPISSAKIHMDGLEAMVDTRGGITAIRQGSHARKLTTWIDSCASILLEAPARFTLALGDDEDHPTDWFPYSTLAQTYLTKLATHTSLPQLSTSIISIYWGIHNVTQLKEITSRLSKQPEILSYSDMVERLERRTVDVVQSAQFNSESNANSAIILLFGNAILLHIYTFMREMPLGISFLSTLSQRIRRTISSLPPGVLDELQSTYPELCLWVYVVAGIGGIGTDDRCHFAGLARDFGNRMSLTGLAGVETFLRGWMWCESYGGKGTEGFWNDFRGHGESMEDVENELLAEENDIGE